MCALFILTTCLSDLPEEPHKDETRREDEASVSHYCCICIVVYFVN